MGGTLGLVSLSQRTIKSIQSHNGSLNLFQLAQIQIFQNKQILIAPTRISSQFVIHQLV